MIRYSLAPSTLIGGFDAVSIRIREGGELYTRTFDVGSAQCAGRISGRSAVCGNSTYALYQHRAGRWQSLTRS
jgi:hypothetical protein